MSDPSSRRPGATATDSAPDAAGTGLRVCLVHVAGRVQGVYFRAHTANKAAMLGVRGYARNLEDGRVEVLAGGAHSAIEQLLDELRRGPPLAVVTSCVITELAPHAIEGHREFARE